MGLYPEQQQQLKLLTISGTSLVTSKATTQVFVAKGSQEFDIEMLLYKSTNFASSEFLTNTFLCPKPIALPRPGV